MIHLGELPERGVILLLLHALGLAQQAVRQQHCRLEHLPLESPPHLPSSELLAELVVERCAELQHWITRYNDVIDYVLDHCSSDSDDPF